MICIQYGCGKIATSGAQNTISYLVSVEFDLLLKCHSHEFTQGFRAILA